MQLEKLLLQDSDSDTSESAADGSQLVTWLCGVGLLTFALFVSARMGIYQEWLYSHHGKHSREALFYIVGVHTSGFLSSRVLV